MKSTRIKEPVRLREKQLSNGNVSLYLDCYYNGKRQYEFLKLYLIPERSKDDRERNRETLRIANAVKAQRVIEMQRGAHGLNSGASNKRRVLFYEYLQDACERKEAKHSRGYSGIYRSCLRHLKRYDGDEKLTMGDITPQWVQGFRDYLEAEACHCDTGAPLSTNTRQMYFSTFRALICQAMKEGMIVDDPFHGVEPLSKEEVSRMYLTAGEVRKLFGAECTHPEVKRAFLFSCLTGLRHSDVQRLTWGDVQLQGDLTRLVFRQKKTRGQEYLDINSQAAALMGARGKAEEHVFPNMISPNFANVIISQWVRSVGIAKHITFHCARHTFAVMMLDLGTDIYTVSKLLGHRELRTTQIYAKVLDKAKQEAVRLIPDFGGFDGK